MCVCIAAHSKLDLYYITSDDKLLAKYFIGHTCV